MRMVRKYWLLNLLAIIAPLLSKCCPELLTDAYFLLFDADLEKCINRNQERSLNQRLPDDHYVPEIS